MQNYLKSTLKNFQNPLFLDIPIGFLFLDQAIWRNTKQQRRIFGAFPKVNNRKRYKILQKS
jgi:hypothetical protein